MGMYSFFQFAARVLLDRVASTFKAKKRRTQSTNLVSMTRFAAAFCSAWLSFSIINSTSRSKRVQEEATASRETTAEEIRSCEGSLSNAIVREDRRSLQFSAGATLDLTLFVAIRSVETVIGEFWFRYQCFRKSRGKRTTFEEYFPRFLDASVFAVSSGLIMWSWIYYPARLPRGYNTWITAVAQVDHRLIKLLRKARAGEFNYGHDADKAPILESMCKDFNWPLRWADPSQTIPIPCDVVHSGLGPSCYWHVAVRFSRAFKFALITYLPLQLVMKMRNPSRNALWRALVEAFRSSAFLGAFVGLFWSGVCVSRTQLGPKVFGPRIVTPIMWDRGLCIRVGCILCGWSILIEATKRRQEITFFVAPKATATLLPRDYDRKVRHFPLN